MVESGDRLEMVEWVERVGMVQFRGRQAMVWLVVRIGLAAAAAVPAGPVGLGRVVRGVVVCSLMCWSICGFLEGMGMRVWVGSMLVGGWSQ
jgi:hypothetical protein